MTDTQSQTIYLVACEASGDAHGAHLARRLRESRPNITLRGLGGRHMKEAGVSIDFDMTTISALGFGDVIKNYFTYKKILDDTASIIKKTKPNIVVCMDSPAFNLRLAKKISSATKVIYFISPQLWAWGERRIAVVKKHITQMLVILPFEVDFYRKHNVKAEYVGHPIIEKIPMSRSNTVKAVLDLEETDRAVGLFPGSREKEIRRILPIMLEAAKEIQNRFPDMHFYIKRSDNIEPAVYNEIIKSSNLKIHDSTLTFYELVRNVDFALVTSGTATLETALIGTPFLLMYKTGFSTYFLGKHLIKVKYLGLANLLLNKPVIPEFIQNEATSDAIAKKAISYLENPELSKEMQDEFRKLREILGTENAIEKTSKAILRALETSKAE